MEWKKQKQQLPLKGEGKEGHYGGCPHPSTWLSYACENVTRDAFSYSISTIAKKFHRPNVSCLVSISKPFFRAVSNTSMPHASMRGRKRRPCSIPFGTPRLPVYQPLRKYLGSGAVEEDSFAVLSEHLFRTLRVWRCWRVVRILAKKLATVQALPPDPFPHGDTARVNYLCFSTQVQNISATTWLFFASGFFSSAEIVPLEDRLPRTLRRSQSRIPSRVVRSSPY